MNLYSRSEVEKMIDVTKGRVRFYVDQGVIPDFIPAKGRGFDRGYSKNEVFILAIAAEMSRSGIALDITKRLIKFLTEHEKSVLDVDNYSDISYNPIGIISKNKFVILSAFDNYFNIEPNGISCIVKFRTIFDSIKF